MAQFGVWFTKGHIVGARSSSAIWVEAETKGEAILAAKKEPRFQDLKKTHYLDRVVGPY